MSIKNIYVHKPMTKFSFLQKHDSNHENKTTLIERKFSSVKPQSVGIFKLF